MASKETVQGSLNLLDTKKAFPSRLIISVIAVLAALALLFPFYS